MMAMLAVAIGGAAGTLLRYGVTTAFVRSGRTSLPATWLVNMLGTCVLGIVLGADALRSTWSLLLGVGFTGGLTTFSTWTLELLRMPARESRRRLAYMLVTLAGGWLCAYIGWLIATHFIR